MIEMQGNAAMETTNKAPMKLTKGTLMQIPEGLWIASNCMTGAGYPIYAAQVAPPEEREAQWIAIRDAEANGRGFWFFRTESELLQWVSQLRQDGRDYVDVEALTRQGLN